MFGLLTRSSRARKSVTRRTTTLCLERLEDRLTPSGGPGSVGSGSEIISLDVTYQQGRQAIFSGQLTDASGPVANQAINLTGVVNATAITNSQGNYSITVSVPQLGTEYAASANGLSNTAQYTLVRGDLTISSFTATAEGNGLWLLSGTVSGEPTEGGVVYFGGMPALQGQSTEVNPDGTFELYVIIPSGQGGWATAQVVDWWGDPSMTTMTLAGD